MSSTTQLAATLIGNSASSLAGFVASELCTPGEDGGRDFDAWKAHAHQRFLQLRAALLLEEPRLLADEVRWSHSAFDLRGLEKEDLARSLEVMREVIEEKLPAPIGGVASDYLLQATRHLAESTPSVQRLAPADRLAWRYVELVLGGDRQAAISSIVDAFEAGTDPIDLYENVLVPAQREIGELWHSGEIGIAQEHFCTSTTQRSMVVLAHRAQSALRERAISDEPTGRQRTVIAAATSGNAHDMALRVLTDLFELRGWRSILLGSDVPARDLVVGIEVFDTDLLLLSGTLAVHLPGIRDTIQLLRDSLPDRDLKVLVGGRAFGGAEDLWRKVGADGCTASAREALELAERLCPRAEA